MSSRERLFGSLFHEEFFDVFLMDETGRFEGSVAIFVLHIESGALLDEKFHGFEIIGAHRKMKGSLVQAVYGIYVGSIGNEYLHDIEGALHGAGSSGDGTVKGRILGLVLRVQIGALAYKIFYDICAVFQGCQVKGSKPILVFCPDHIFILGYELPDPGQISKADSLPDIGGFLTARSSRHQHHQGCKDYEDSTTHVAPLSLRYGKTRAELVFCHGMNLLNFGNMILHCFGIPEFHPNLIGFR